MSNLNKEFPAFYLPRSSTKNKGQSVVDYGIDDVIDININHEETEYYSRKSFPQTQKRDNFRSICFPLSKPNVQANLPVYDELFDSWISPHAQNPNHIGKNLKTTNKQHLDRLLLDHPDLLIGSFMDEMNTKCRHVLDRHFHPLKYSFDIAVKYNSWSCPPYDYMSYFHENLKYSVRRFDVRRQSHSYVFLKKLDGLLGTLFEIPRELILDYLDESLTDQYDLLTENHHLGNCLAFCDDCILYPQGAMNTLRIDPVTVAPSQDHYGGFLELDSQYGQSVEMEGEIQELNCVSYETGQSIVGIRSDYSCTLLAKEEQETTFGANEERQIFKPYDTINTESKVLSLAVNPYYEGDAIVTLENGSFYNWTGGQLVRLPNELINRHCTCNELFWAHCCYGSSPRCFLVVHSEEVQMFDMRSPQQPCKLMLQLPNPCLNRMDKLTRASFIHPTNPHQLLLASEQGLIILDERFLNSPVLTINHHMRSSPRFMDVRTDERDSGVHTMAFLGGYKHRSTRCLEFEQPVGNDVPSGLLGNRHRKTRHTKPVTAVRKPWRLEYCDSWLEHYTNDSRVLSAGIDTRLKQPIIGLGIYSAKNEASNELFAVQLTRTGDLFYQPISIEPRIGSGGNQSEDSNTRQDGGSGMSKKRKRKCRHWVDVAYERYVAEPSLNESAKICSEKVNFKEGAIICALEIQRENRQILAAKDTTTLRSDRIEEHCAACSGVAGKEDCELCQGKPVQVNLGNPEASKCTKDHSDGLSELDRNQSNSNELSGSAKEADTDVCSNGSEASAKSYQHNKEHPRSCSLCAFPLTEDELKCSCCMTEVATAEKLRQSSRDRESLLTNKSLDRNIEITFRKLVKFPEKSKDPLSEVLLANWDNDDAYTPIDLEKSPADGEEKSGKKRKTSITPEMDPEPEKEPGWFLSESGTLEFGTKPLLNESPATQNHRPSSVKLRKMDATGMDSKCIDDSTEHDRSTTRSHSLQSPSMPVNASFETRSKTRFNVRFDDTIIVSTCAKNVSKFVTETPIEGYIFSKDHSENKEPLLSDLCGVDTTKEQFRSSEAFQVISRPSANDVINSKGKSVFKPDSLSKKTDVNTTNNFVRILDFESGLCEPEHLIAAPSLLTKEQKENLPGRTSLPIENNSKISNLEASTKSYDSPRKKKSGRVMGF